MLWKIRKIAIENLKPEYILAGIFLVVALALYLPRVTTWDTFKWPILLPAAFFWVLMLGNRRLIPYLWLAVLLAILPVGTILWALTAHVRNQSTGPFNWPYFYAVAGRFFLHIAIVSAFAWIVQHRKISGFTITQLVKSWLPFVIMALIYENMHDLVVTLNPKVMDAMLIQWDLNLFGSHLSVWMERLVSPGLNDFFSAIYHSYLLYPMFLGFSLYRSPVDRETSFRRFMLAYLYSCYIGFVGYILVPGIGPYYGLSHLYMIPLEGGLLTQLNNHLYQSFSNMRDVFPSLHTANTLICLVFAFRYRRRLFWYFLLPATSLVVSTIYLRYHYTIDVVAGIILVPIACTLGEQTDRAWSWLKHLGTHLHEKKQVTPTSSLSLPQE
ncbi:MAG: phosphatase PAP2 family protein [Deltaproteobacteria bacterium]|nr:phosphatase PAP2 family protein [Deltaproteobacteria bacterium]